MLRADPCFSLHEILHSRFEQCSILVGAAMVVCLAV